MTFSSEYKRKLNGFWLLSAKTYHRGGQLFLNIADKRVNFETRDALVMGIERLNTPVLFEVSKKGPLTDFIDNTMFAEIVSEKVVGLFRQRGFSGWEANKVLIDYPEMGHPINGYSYLSIHGRAGALDERAVLKWMDLGQGRRAPFKFLGFYFDVTTWDGSDFFFLENRTTLIVTERVIEALRSVKATGWESKSVLDGPF